MAPWQQASGALAQTTPTRATSPEGEVLIYFGIGNGANAVACHPIGTGSCPIAAPPPSLCRPLPSTRATDKRNLIRH